MPRLIDKVLICSNKARANALSLKECRDNLNERLRDKAISSLDKFIAESDEILKEIVEGEL